jgi:hypothetical protein
VGAERLADVPRASVLCVQLDRLEVVHVVCAPSRQYADP